MLNDVKLLILFLIVFNITACEYECPGFNDIYDKYVTYNLNDKISYSNGIDTLNFNVVDFYRETPNSFRGLAMDVECFEEKYYVTNNQSDYQISESYETAFSSFDDDIKISITNNDNFGLRLYDFNSENYDYSKVEFNQNYEYNGINYNEVIFLLKDTLNSNPKIGYIIKANPGGVLEFYDFEKKEIWQQIK